MLGRTHIAAAIFMAALFFSFFKFDLLTNILVLVILVIGSIFPDIDSSTSIMGRKFKLISFLTKHRGFLHSIWSLILFSILVYLLLSPLLGIVFATGFILHLMLDAITKEGVKIFGKRIRGPFKVGSIGEKVFYALLLIGTVVVLLV